MLHPMRALVPEDIPARATAQRDAAVRVLTRAAIKQTVAAVDRIGMDPAIRMTASRERAKVPAPRTIENGLCHDRARRIAGAEEQDIEHFLFGGVAHGFIFGFS